MTSPFREWADVGKDGAAFLPNVKVVKRLSPSPPMLRPPQADPDKEHIRGKKRKRIKRPVPVFPNTYQKSKKPKILR